MGTEAAATMLEKLKAKSFFGHIQDSIHRHQFLAIKRKERSCKYPPEFIEKPLYMWNMNRIRE